MRWSPRETTSILLEYVRTVASSAHHSGVSLATAQINKYFHLNSQNEFLPVRTCTCSSFAFMWVCVCVSTPLYLSLPPPPSLPSSFPQSSVSDGRPPCVKDQLSLQSSSLHLRSLHSGEVAGMVAAASLITGTSPGNEEGEAVTKLAAVFTSQLRDALRDGMGEWE